MICQHNPCYYPYASFTNAQLPLLKVTTRCFDKRVILDPVDASSATIGSDGHAREAVRQLQDAGILQTVTPADVLAKYAGPITDAIRRGMGDREFCLCFSLGVALRETETLFCPATVPAVTV